MNNSNVMNLNVDDYEQEELLILLNIENKDPISYDDIVDASQPYINKYTSDKNYDLANFFQQVQNQLLDDIENDDYDNIQQSESSQLGSLWQNENVSQKQTDPVQSNKVTERKQKVQIFKENENYIMNRNQLGVSNNFQLPVAQGQLNPNLKNITTRVINIDSQYRENILPFSINPDGPSSGTNFTMDLSDPIHNAIELKVTSYQIPFTWYLIDSDWKNNNCFYVCKNEMIDCSMISIPSGNYTQDDLIEAINLSLTNNGLSDIEFSYNYRNGKSIITNSSTEKYTIVFYDPNGTYNCNSSCKNNQKINNNLGWILGFRGNTNKNEEKYGQMIYDISGNNIITSESLIDIIGSKYFLLMLDDYQQNHLNRGLVGITPTQKNVEIPSYWNSDLQVATDNSGNVSCEYPEVSGGYSRKLVPTYIQNVPKRRLTQAQLYTLNSTTQARAQTQQNRLTSPTTSNIIALIPLKGINSLSFGKILIDDFNLRDNERVYFGPVDLERFRIRLVDDQGYTLNLNGNNWSFTMLVTSLYQY
jgi:hypothetical protein